jgi:general secretion pathway protein G
MKMRMAAIHQLPKRQSPRRKGFTLVEILIVVVILGIMATIVVPQFSNASQQARENTLKDELRYLRTQLTVYKAQHRDVAAGYPNGISTAAPDEATLVQQMTQYTNDNGQVSSSASSTFRFGTYLMKMPPNPKNQLNSVRVIGNGQAMPQPDGTTGWIYKPQTLELMANVSGNDTNGVPYSSY